MTYALELECTQSVLLMPELHIPDCKSKATNYRQSNHERHGDGHRFQLVKMLHHCTYVPSVCVWSVNKSKKKHYLTEIYTKVRIISFWANRCVFTCIVAQKTISVLFNCCVCVRVFATYWGRFLAVCVWTSSPYRDQRLVLMSENMISEFNFYEFRLGWGYSLDKGWS